MKSRIVGSTELDNMRYAGKEEILATAPVAVLSCGAGCGYRCIACMQATDFYSKF